MSARVRRTVAALGVAWAVAVALHVPGEAHKAITSKYTFNEDLFPLFRERCGQCHVDGGVAPMSLMTHEDAAPWAESLRLELLGEEPPPWHPLRLSARELDMILVWANGGTPRGDASKPPPAVPLVNDWADGKPDAALPMPAPFVLAAAANEATHDVTLPLTGVVGKDIAAVDLRPGTPAVVRSATLVLKAADGTRKTLGTWYPGQREALRLDAPVRVAAGSALVTTIEYRRTWKYEGQELTDRSTIGVYTVKPRPGRR